MTPALGEFTGETEFTRIDVEVDDGDPEEWPTVMVFLSAVHGDGNPEDRTLYLSMDEARVVIAGLAAVVR